MGVKALYSEIITSGSGIHGSSGYPDNNYIRVMRQSQILFPFFFVLNFCFVFFVLIVLAVGLNLIIIFPREACDAGDRYF